MIDTFGGEGQRGEIYFTQLESLINQKCKEHQVDFKNLFCFKRNCTFVTNYVFVHVLRSCI